MNTELNEMRKIAMPDIWGKENWKGLGSTKTHRCGLAHCGESTVGKPVWLESSEAWQELLEMVEKVHRNH